MEQRLFTEELPSTQEAALRLARAGAPVGTRVVARRQTEGVGRRGHRWESPEGGLYLSIVERAPSERRSMVAVGVASELLDRFAADYSVETSFKWPNDLIVTVAGHGRKLSGILADEVDSPTLGRAVVVGVGLNVTTPARSFSPALRNEVVSLASVTQSPPTLDEAERFTVRAVEDALKALGSPDDTRRLLARARDSLYGQGRRATVDGKVHGVILTLGDEGQLLLDTGHGSVSVRAGDLAIEEAA